MGEGLRPWARRAAMGGAAALLVAAGAALYFSGAGESLLLWLDARLASVGAGESPPEPAPAREARSGPEAPTFRGQPTLPETKTGLRIAGRVVAEDGSRLAPLDLVATFSDGTGFVRARSTREGRFEFTGIAAGAVVLLYVEEPGYAAVPYSPADGRVEMGDTDLADLEVTIGREVSLSGVVVDSAGSPRGWVRVVARPVNRMSAEFPSAQSAADGAITIRRLSPGEYELEFPDASGNRGAGPAPQRITIPIGESLDGVLIVCPDELPSKLSVSGRVTDTKGAAISGANVWLRDQSWIASTDSEGRFSAGLEPGVYDVVAMHSGYSDSEPVSVGESTAELELILGPTGTVEGRVVDATTGRAVSAFRVRARDQGRATTVKNAEGKFVLSGVKAGTTAISAFAAGYAETWLRIPRLGPGETRRNVEIRIEAGCEIEGRVVDTSGRPVRLAHVSTGGGAAGPGRDPRMSDVSNDDGGFYLPAVPAGPLRLRVTHERFAPTEVRVNVARGILNEFRVVLTKGARLHGRISRAGAPVGYGYVYSQSAYGDGGYARVETDGRFEIGGVPEGPVDVRLSLDRDERRSQYSKRFVVVDGDLPELEIDLAPSTARIEGVVYTAEGITARAPLEIVAYQLDSAGWMLRSVSDVGDDGRFALAVPAGPVSLAVAPGRVETKYLRVEAVEGETLHRDIALFEGATLRVAVRDRDESSVPRFWLLEGAVEVSDVSAAFVQNLPPQLAATARLDAEGLGTVHGLSPGRYTALAAVGEVDLDGGPATYRRWRTEPVEIVGDGNVDVFLDLDR